MWPTPVQSGKKVAFVTDWGAFLGVKNGMFTCSVKGETKWSVPPVELDALVLEVNCSISSEAVKLANEHGVDLVFMDKGDPVARVVGAKYGGSPRIWVAQLKSVRRSGELAWSFVRGKLRNQATTLRYYGRKYGGKAEEALNGLERAMEAEVTTREKAMQVEAAAAKLYWSAVKELIPRELRFPGRRFKIKAEDPFNVALNLGYGFLRMRTWRAVVVAGLLPYVGFLHKYRPGRPSLVFDLMEEFRSPFVDRPLIALARENWEKISERKELYRVFTESVDGGEVLRQARRLANAIVDGEQYKPFVSK